MYHALSIVVLLLYGCQDSGHKHRVNLSWHPPSNIAQTGPVKYKVYRSTGLGSYVVISQGIPTTSYADASVVARQVYRYEVTAVNNSGKESPPSNVFTVTVP